MEKDSNKNDSSSSSSEDNLDDNQKLQSISDLEKYLILQQQNLQQQLENIKKTMDVNQTTIPHYKDTLFETGFSLPQSLDLECHVPPIASPICKYQNLSEDAFPNLLDSTVLSGSLKKVEVISRGIIKKFASIDGSFEEHNQPSAKESSNILHNLEILKKMLETQNTQLFNSSSLQASPPDNKTQETFVDIGSDTRIEDLSLRGLLEADSETNAVSGGNSVGKGKESANPKFRYKKRSKPDVSSSESITKLTPVKDSKEAFGISDSKAVKSQSPKEKFTKISPSAKRKGSDSIEQGDDKRQLNESGGRTFSFSQLFGNLGEGDNLKVEKKLKFEDHKNTSKRYPVLTSLLSQRDPEKLCLNPHEFIEKSQTDQSENEWSILPSTSGSTSTVHLQFTSEESSSTDKREDVPPCGIEESSSTGEIKDVPFSRTIKESSLTIASKDVALHEKEESCHICARENASLSGEPTIASKKEQSLRISEEAVPSNTQDS